MDIIGPCPEAAVFHSACLLAEEVSTIGITIRSVSRSASRSLFMGSRFSAANRIFAADILPYTILRRKTAVRSRARFERK